MTQCIFSTGKRKCRTATYERYEMKYRWEVSGNLLNNMTTDRGFFQVRKPGSAGDFSQVRLCVPPENS